MQINKSARNVKLYFLVSILALAQIFINSSASIYLDILGMLLIVLLVNRTILFYQLILVAIIADLIGKWYLGTHAFSVILLGIISNRYFNFYKMLSSLNQIIFIIIYAIFQSAIISIIGLVTRNLSFHVINLLLELIIVCPIIFMLVRKLFYNHIESPFQ